MTRAEADGYKAALEGCSGLTIGPDHLVEVAGKLLVDVPADNLHVEAAEEGMPWRGGNEVKVPPLTPDEAYRSCKPGCCGASL